MLRTRIHTKPYQLFFMILLSLTLSGCKQKEEAVQKDDKSKVGSELLLQLQDNSNEQTVERTTKVFRGDFTKSIKAKAELQFTKSSLVTYETKRITTIFGEYLVSDGQYVNAGDPIAKVRYEADPVRLEELKIELKQLEEKAEIDLYFKNEKITNLEDQIKQSTQSLETTKLENELVAARNDYTSYQSDIANQKQVINEEIEDYDLNGTSDFIYAPCSGIIAIPEKIETDTSLWYGQLVLAIHDPSSAILVLEDVNSQIRYGMEVSIEVTNHQATENLTGKVVSGDNLLEEERRIGYAFIRIDDFDSTKYLEAKFKVTAMFTDIKDVLLVEESAVSVEDSNTYITCLEDGKRKKVYFISGGMNDTYYWVLEGLEEGMAALK